MSLLVLSYPDISEKDFEWIQKIRKEHDELYYKVAAPHFTIVFPVFNMEPDLFIKNIKNMAENIKAFDFTMRCAVIVKDSFNEYSHVFLVPDEGYSHIVKLHDRLYTGLLLPELRLDIPFIPHVGAGNSISPETCKSLADRLNQENFAIMGTIKDLDIVEYNNNTVKTIEKITLAKI